MNGFKAPRTYESFRKKKINGILLRPTPEMKAVLEEIMMETGCSGSRLVHLMVEYAIKNMGEKVSDYHAVPSKKPLFFDAEDFMWPNGTPLSPSESSHQANSMFQKWFIAQIEQSKGE